MPSFLLNSDDDGDDVPEHGQSNGQLVHDKIAEAVQARAAVMFSGELAAFLMVVSTRPVVQGPWPCATFNRLSPLVYMCGVCMP